jgi:hypothetical protein
MVKTPKFLSFSKRKTYGINFPFLKGSLNHIDSLQQEFDNLIKR